MRTLEDQFLEFHEKNPQIYELFKHYALEMLASGRPRYSARTIIHRIRWHNDISTNSKDGFKINNNHSRLYSEMLERDLPVFIGFFQHREASHGI